jgi:hypothetical protein
MPDYKAGNLVENTGRPDWGPGKIVHIAGDNLYVLFRDLEESKAKKLKANTPALRLAASQSDSILDNLPPLTEKKGEWVLPGNRLTLKSLTDRFLQEFPQGFSDPKYLKEERNSKLDVHDVFQHQLGVDQTKDLLSRGETRMLVAKARSVLHEVHLLDPQFGVGPFQDAMQDENAATRFFKALVELLESTSVNETAFAKYASVVCSLPAARGPVATWPIATVFPYIARPDIHMFLKPDVTKKAAETLGFDLMYKSTLNWTTYERLLRMGKTYLDLLRSLGAIDFVDIQSFIHASCGGKDRHRPIARQKPEVVLKVASEGGGIKLLREKQKGKNYQFWTERDETAMSGLLDDDDLIDVGDLTSCSSRFDSLDEAFRELDRYPWHRFSPIEVHPDLRVEVLREVGRKGGDTEEKRWKAALREI